MTLKRHFKFYLQLLGCFTSVLLVFWIMNNSKLPHGNNGMVTANKRMHYGDSETNKRYTNFDTDKYLLDRLRNHHVTLTARKAYFRNSNGPMTVGGRNVDRPRHGIATSTTSAEPYTRTTPGPPLKADNEGGETKRIFKIMKVNSRQNSAFKPSFEECEFTSCALTSNPREADLWFWTDFIWTTSKSHQGNRARCTTWMMRTRQAPLWDSTRYSPMNRPDFMNQINWTNTVFDDSTFQIKYGILKDRGAPQKDYEQIFKRKKFDVAWFVSHCNASSRRDEYVKRMMSKIDVHIYGECGDRTCGFDNSARNKTCLGLLSNSYKFYLSFENGFCRDYVTEKFFNMFMDIDVIPVVRGGTDYDRLFPSGTFINAADFGSPERLGEYLYKLSRNEAKYLAMLRRKNRYVLGNLPPLQCELCKALHTRKTVNVYKNITAWLYRPGNCWRPRDL